MESEVQAHYNSDNLTERIMAAFNAAGKDPSALTPRDLSIIDQLHTGGARASLLLFEKARITPGDRVLDAGCGIGGSSRMLAEQMDCRVTGIDLADQFINAARVLTSATRLDNLIEFHQGSVLDLPFEKGSFDVILSQHMLMNIEDKNTVAQQFSRVLKKGGTLVLHEIFKGNDLPVKYPVNWAPVPGISFLETWPSMLKYFNENGFQSVLTSDESASAAAWWKKANNALEKNNGWKSPLNPTLFFGDIAKEFASNMMHNFQYRSTCLIEAVLKKR